MPGFESLRVLVIHLSRASGRRAHMERQIASAGLEQVSWIPAVDALAPGFTPRDGLTVRGENVLINLNWDGRTYVRTEEAIFQSHLAALRALVESEARFGVILEDDAELAPDFRAAVEATLRLADHWDMVRLDACRTRFGRPAVGVGRAASYALVASLNPCAGAAAYLVTRDAARTLLEQSEGVFEPFDNYLNAVWRHRLRFLDVSPAPARQALLGSMREEHLPVPARNAAEALLAWQRHVRADFVGRYLRRWVQQLATFGPARLTIARWSRDWSA